MCLPLNNVNLSHGGLEAAPNGHRKHHAVFTSFHPPGSAALLGLANQFFSILCDGVAGYVLPFTFSGACLVPWTTLGILYINMYMYICAYISKVNTDSCTFWFLHYMLMNEHKHNHLANLYNYLIQRDTSYRY